MGSFLQHLIDSIGSTRFVDSDCHAAIFRTEIPVDSQDSLEWLKGIESPVRFYFANRDSSLRTAAIGSAQIIADAGFSLREAIELIEKNVRGTSAMYFGAVGFDTDLDVALEWQRFGSFTFILPRFELINRDGKTFFAANAMASTGFGYSRAKDDILKELSQIDEAQKNFEISTAINSESVPGKEQWLGVVSDVIEEIVSGDLKKVVLARKMVLEMPALVDPVTLLGEICSDDSPTYEFCLQTANNTAFLGASPECLFRIDGNSIYTEALAGTAGVGTTDTQTSKFSNSLKNSKKDLLEQAYVREDVLDALADISSGITTDHHPRVVKLKSLQHLITDYTGTLKDAVDIFDVIKSLHPTAAVNGLPRDLALDIINTREPFSRGLYAGPIGYIGDGVAEFAVAIRSALIQQCNIHLYAGAGIVKASDPEAEWIETENKLQQFLDILT